ncbi:uncharacterized protein LOC114879445 isoform X1 [Osmia bicornis bicornis]|uniref:uncharacterized protein LOC114879445 isoform X1 n=2 Tax=Osmia bicornis bicornis TaxID=1437191 RepID=UPI0010F542A5|nr:uncharacterized protein LOC114879445 isoform X1 [Osmia bicornis bicornis]
MTKRIKGMRGRSSAKRTSLCLLALLFCLSGDNLLLVVGEPEPIPSELFYSESLINKAEKFILFNKLKQVIEEQKEVEERKKELDDMEVMIGTVLESRTKPKTRNGDYIEELPTPNAIISPRPSKRTAISYMALCHFKICNMGRKRQLHN